MGICFEVQMMTAPLREHSNFVGSQIKLQVWFSQLYPKQYLIICLCACMGDAFEHRPRDCLGKSISQLVAGKFLLFPTVCMEATDLSANMKISCTF